MYAYIYVKSQFNTQEKEYFYLFTYLNCSERNNNINK
jgi:hypothetical protein